MKAPLWVYVLAQFLIGFSSAAAMAVTPKDWVIAICATLGSALLNALAKTDNSTGGPTPPASVLRTAGIVAIVVMVLTLSACSSLPPIKGKVCYTDQRSGNQVCALSDGKTITVEGDIQQF